MDIQVLTTFFMWCTIINVILFVTSSSMIMFMPDFVYRIQTRAFSISRESYDAVMYALLGVFKLLLIFFSIVPYIALLIVGS